MKYFNMSEKHLIRVGGYARDTRCKRYEPRRVKNIFIDIRTRKTFVELEGIEEECDSRWIISARKEIQKAVSLVDINGETDLGNPAFSIKKGEELIICYYGSYHKRQNPQDMVVVKKLTDHHLEILMDVNDLKLKEIHQEMSLEEIHQEMSVNLVKKIRRKKDEKETQ